MSTTPHRWTFMRAGGVDQVVIREGADVTQLEQLDQKLWVALACPTRGLELDERMLDLIDADKDGRIRPPELIAVSRWVREHLAEPGVLFAPADGGVPLRAIATGTDSGRQLLAEAKALLALIDKPEADRIGLADLEAYATRLAELGINGDGVVPEQAAEAADTAELIRAVLEHVGSVIDRNGHPGVDQAHADAFFEQAAALQAWRRQALDDATLAPLGDASQAAAEALGAVRAKVDDFYARCALVAYDATAQSPLNPADTDYRAMAESLLSAQSAAIEGLPLAAAGAGRALPLRAGLNPAWAARVEALRTQAVEPLLGAELDELDEAGWLKLKSRLAACSDWLTAKPRTTLDALPAEQLDTLLSGDAKARLDALIRRDAELSPSNLRFDELQRLVRYQRSLVLLLNNFVSFSEFYGRRGGIFEAGTLYLDARSCDLAVAVQDVGTHAPLALRSKAYLAYCQCTREGQKMTIAAAFTAGDVDDLFVGRNGVFYDRQGRDWDATITKVIENPISIRQAFFLPYKKFLRLIEQQVAKRAAASDKASDDLLVGVAKGAVPDQGAPKPPDAAADRQRRIDVGTVAALGVALGSISAVLVGVFGKFVDLGWWIPVALLCIMAAISGPSMVIAALKLRLRSLGPVLDASGWAINGRMRINVPLGRMLTQRAELPAGAQRQLDDPYRTSHTGAYVAALVVVALGALVVAWRLGLIGVAALPG